MVFARKLELAREKLRRAEDALGAFRSSIKSDYQEHTRLVEDVNRARKELLDLETSLWPGVKDADSGEGDKEG